MSEDRTPPSPAVDPASAPDAAPPPLAGPDDTAAALLLARIVAATARATGDAFVDALPEAITTTLGVRHALLLLRDPDDAGLLRRRAGWSNGRALDDQHLDVAGTPLGDALDRGAARRADGGDALADAARRAGLDRVESALAVPLRAHDGTTAGVLAVLHDAVLPATPAWPRLLDVLATRVVGELERADVERRLRESEETFRGLFEEAPIA